MREKIKLFFSNSCGRGLVMRIRFCCVRGYGAGYVFSVYCFLLRHNAVRRFRLNDCPYSVHIGSVPGDVFGVCFHSSSIRLAIFSLGYLVFAYKNLPRYSRERAYRSFFKIKEPRGRVPKWHCQGYVMFWFQMYTIGLDMKERI